jgi:hypothetical protein
LGCDKDVLAFLTTTGLSKYAPTFAREKIRAHNMAELQRDDLEELGLTMQDIDNFLSHVQKLALSAKDVKASNQQQPTATPQPKAGNAGQLWVSLFRGKRLNLL